MVIETLIVASIVEESAKSGSYGIGIVRRPIDKFETKTASHLPLNIVTADWIRVGLIVQ